MKEAPALLPVLTPWALRAQRTPVDAPADEVRFVGRTVPTPWPAAYGGDLSVGALSAAARTVDPRRRVHSLNLNFLRPVDRDAELEYWVRPIRDGLTYASRTVSLRQGGLEMANATVSFRRRDAAEKQVTGVARPEPQLPQSFATAGEAIAARGPLAQGIGLDQYWVTGRGLDVRHVTPHSYGVAAAEVACENLLWVRLDPASPAADGLRANAWGGPALLAYLADDTILEPALRALGLGWQTPGLFSTSIDQKIWFHADAEPGEWLLFRQRLLSRSGSHVVCEGQLFREDGVLAATVVQEGLIRRTSPMPK